MEEYPRNVMELEKLFSTEDACKVYLFRLRRPTGFVCPHCQTKGDWKATRDRLVCRRCQQQTTVTSVTIFHDTRKPLTMWFRAVWHVTCQEHGARAMSYGGWEVMRRRGLGCINSDGQWFDRLGTVYREWLKSMKLMGQRRRRNDWSSNRNQSLDCRCRRR